jgi:hypothetical protein
VAKVSSRHDKFSFIENFDLNCRQAKDKLKLFHFAMCAFVIALPELQHFLCVVQVRIETEILPSYFLRNRDIPDHNIGLTFCKKFAGTLKGDRSHKRYPNFKKNANFEPRSDRYAINYPDCVLYLMGH